MFLCHMFSLCSATYSLHIQGSRPSKLTLTQSPCSYGLHGSRYYCHTPCNLLLLTNLQPASARDICVAFIDTPNHVPVRPYHADALQLTARTAHTYRCPPFPCDPILVATLLRFDSQSLCPSKWSPRRCAPREICLCQTSCQMHQPFAVGSRRT